MSVIVYMSLLIFVAIVNGQGARPSEQEIFGSLVENLDTTDLLFTCDFYQTHKYKCNVTQQGVPFLKRPKKTSDAKKDVQSDKSGKVAVPSVTGQWSDDDGIIKKSYAKSDYLNIVAKCFFRTEYFECFGVPKCKDNQPKGMSPCSGGEPWRGTYEGAPNIGFHGNVTSHAMQTAGGPPQPDSERMVEPVDLPPAYANPSGNADADQPYNSETPSPTETNLTQVAPATPPQKPNMIVKEFSNVDNKTGVSSKGAIAVSPDGSSVMMVNSQTFNRTLPSGVSVGGSAFASSRSGSSSAQIADGQGNSMNFDFGSPFSASSNVGSSSSMSFPSQSLFPSWFQTGNSGFGSLFGNIFAPFVQSPVVTPAPFIAPVDPVLQNLTAPVTPVTADPCQGQQTSSALRCMVLDFQRTVTNNILNSLTNSFSRFGTNGFGSMFQQQNTDTGGSTGAGSSVFQQQQSNSFGPQSRSFSGPVRTGGAVQISSQQQQQPFFGSSFGNLFSNSNDDDWFRFRK